MSHHTGAMISTDLYQITVLMNITPFAAEIQIIKNIIAQLRIRQCQIKGISGRKVPRAAKTGKTGSFMMKVEVKVPMRWERMADFGP